VLKIWKKITAHFQDDAKVQTAASAVALDPADEDFLKKFAKTLANRLAANQDCFNNERSLTVRWRPLSTALCQVD
jgi:hypothetical protein